MSLLGSIAVSTAGRDKGRTCIIVGVLDERYVLIADGRKRKIEKPKKKKMKHIRPVGRLDGDLAALLKDKRLSNRTAAKIVSSYHNSPEH
jgi:ribosomal protein L14E/L6E/L27E